MEGSTRLSMIKSHLLGNFTFDYDPSLDEYRKRGKNFNTNTLKNYYYEIGFQHYDELISAFSACPSMTERGFSAQTKDEKRRLLMLQIQEVSQHLKISRDEFLKDPLRNLIFGIYGLNFDMSFCIKIGVHLALYIDSLMNLGTEKHYNLIDRGNSLKDIGCFGLTELGRGSNVALCGTTAHYIHETREFIINTPNSLSAKWWIGGAAQTSNKSVIFAQLYIGKVNYGVHGFVIDLRDKIKFNPLPGIIIGDCGSKSENDAIDNGFIIFKEHKVPYDALLDKVSQITPDGKYVSSIKKKEKRLGKMLSCLIRGRTACVNSSEGNLKNALTSAVRWAAIRKQFGPNPNKEVPILDYLLTRTRLLPHLANLFANCAANEIILTRYQNIKNLMEADFERVEGTEFHAVLSSIKVLTTEWAFEGIHQCRKVCGGLGYSKFSKLGELLSKHDINLTWEGDNNILLQQTASFIVKQSMKALQGKPFEVKSLKSLNLNRESVQSSRPPTFILSPNSLLACIEHLLNMYLHKSLLHLQQNSTKFENYFDVWNVSQPVLQSLGRVFGILEIAKYWQGRYESLRQKDSEVFKLLEKLFCLFLVDKLLIYRGELLSEGYFSAAEAKILEDEFENLCNDLGESAVMIIDAIANQDFMHGSCLGYSDGQAYKRYTDLIEAQPECYNDTSSLEAIKKLITP
ncbi:hypothetical protein SteCoe_5344 [Stentor coeruleus]|uniref:Acyl-coenzyme A oxidase n=1 Tax=Stentor coeruleus TaxID=5963 RepID=A0A1R2CSN9_9CILI|nr:hypothetical protein SteCoe_5344 [Stentor coeruleus]